jgi:hypothetical protein
MRVLGAEREAAEWTLVKDGETVGALRHSRGSDLIRGLGLLCHLFIVHGDDDGRGDERASFNFFGFDVK